MTTDNDGLSINAHGVAGLQQALHLQRPLFDSGQSAMSLLEQTYAQKDLSDEVVHGVCKEMRDPVFKAGRGPHGGTGTEGLRLVSVGA